VPPLIIGTIAGVRDKLDSVRRLHKTIGLVPTMGALHQGHARLIETARADCDSVVVSIFVNPLQFGPGEDYLRYPRPLEQDVALCAEKGVEIVFAPETREIYAGQPVTFVDVTRLDQHLCGPHRPGHFRGVATVVLKLFSIVQPNRAYFGEKDYQQLCIIRRMVLDFNLRLEIVAAPTVREPDGLAVSSRNVYLDSQERKSAPALFQALEAARGMIESGENEPARIIAAAKAILEKESQIRFEYLEIVDPDELQSVASINGPVRVAGAIWLGRTRLIDNIAATPL
jgi:pantoate--beta-alanine ligase